MTEIPGVQLIRGDVSRAIESAQNARLVCVDPPWPYRNRTRRGCAATHYPAVRMPDIVQTVDAAYDSAADSAYMLLWSTWPTIGEWFAASLKNHRWRHVTGGSWHKSNGIGIGYHVRGDSEPWLLYAKGEPRPFGTLRNAWRAPRRRHSEKPAEPLRAFVSAMSQPGDLVLDLYAGLAPLARVCMQTGRRYVGAEIDAERHAVAQSRLAECNAAMLAAGGA